MIKICPSVLSCDFANLEREARAVEEAGADMLHLDVMDAHFVPNLTFGAPVIKALRPKSGMVFDTHLMISEPLRYIDDFANAGSDIITFHLESESDPDAVIEKIRANGKRAGISLKPKTPAQAVLPFIQKLDMVLVMTVEPGFGGQRFMADQMDKVAEIRTFANAHHPALDIQVDGGIDDATIGLAAAAGANVFVAGTAIFASPDYGSKIRRLRELAQQSITVSEK